MNFDKKHLQRIAGAIFFLAFALIILPLIFSSSDDPIESDSSAPQSDIEVQQPTAYVAHQIEPAVEEEHSSDEFPSLEMEPQEDAPVVPQYVWDSLEENTSENEHSDESSPVIINDSQQVAVTSPHTQSPVSTPKDNSQNKQKNRNQNTNKPEATKNEVVLPKLDLIAESETVVPSPIAQTHRQQQNRAASKSKYYVQVGAYSNAVSAGNHRQRLSQQGYPVIIESSSDKYRVRLGPYATKAQADNIYNQLKRKGNDARVIQAP